MKPILRKLFLLTALVVSFVVPSIAQDIRVPLVPFTMQVPTVNELTIRPVAAPRFGYIEPDTTTLVFGQDIYYQLKRSDGRTVEDKNKFIPIRLYDLALKYVTKIVSTAELAEINAYLAGGGFTDVVAKKPE